MRGTWIEQVWQYNPILYAPPKHRKACKYKAFLPHQLHPLKFSLDARTAGAVSEAENAIRELSARAQPALAPLARLLLRTESIASSKVEGLQIDAGGLARAETRQETGGRVGQVASEVLANIDATQQALDEAASNKRISVEQICEIHRRLMVAAPNPRIAGRIRTEQNWIGGNDYNPCGAEFVPPPPDRVPELLSDLCQALNEEDLPPLVQASLVHAQFETIHPFDDGNGRTGRALIHLVLRRRGLAPDYVPPISVVLAADRDRYIDGLTRYRDAKVDIWIELFATATSRAARLASAYLEAVHRLVAEWRLELKATANPRSDAAAWAVIELLPGYPIVTAPVAAAASGRAKSAIHGAIDQLTKAGILLPLSQSKRNRSWEARGLLDLVSRLEAGAPP